MQLNFEVDHTICSFLDPTMTMQLAISCRLWRNIVTMTLPRIRIALKGLMDEYGDRHEMFSAQLFNVFELEEVEPASYLCAIIRDLSKMLLSSCKVRKIRQLRTIENQLYNMRYSPYYLSELVGFIWIRV